MRENVYLQVSQLLCHPFCPQPPNQTVLVSISQYNTHTHMCLYIHIRTYTCRHTAACCAIVEFSSFLFSLAALFAPLCLYQSFAARLSIAIVQFVSLFRFNFGNCVSASDSNCKKFSYMYVHVYIFFSLYMYLCTCIFWSVLKICMLPFDAFVCVFARK